ncbi:MAG TPA: GntR family transcriptional regulator [Dermatophilaceae bacterium]|nr:GntR family transcriptional regulator [Dermatophilaceae bacterium]
MSTLQTVSVVDALSDTLRARVLDGHLQPGASLVEADVAAEFGVSRPTARAAITFLVHEGLLRHQAHKSAHVPVLSRADVEDLFLVRIPLELGIVGAVVAQGPPPMDAERAVDALAAVPSGAPHSVFVEADLDFHRALVRAVDSPRLSRLYAALSGEIHLSMVQSRYVLGRDRIAREHREVFQALEAGDAALAEERMRAHLEGAREALASRLDGGASAVEAS